MRCLPTGVLLGVTLAIWAGGATPGLAQNIAEPEVTKGQNKLETFSVLQSGFNHGVAGDTREVQTFNYVRGVTDIWQVKAFLTFERPSHEDFKGTTATIENTFELLNAKRGGIGIAWFTGIVAALDGQETNALQFGPIIRLGGGPLSLVLNPFLEKTFGANREEGLAISYGWQVKQELSKSWWIGVEGFGRIPDFTGAGGPEEHRLGPVVTYEMELADKRTLTLEGGLQFGLSNATPDRAAKLQVTYTY